MSKTLLPLVSSKPNNGYTRPKVLLAAEVKNHTHKLANYGLPSFLISVYRSYNGSVKRLIKVISITLALPLSLGILTACSSGDAGGEADATVKPIPIKPVTDRIPKVLTTFTVIADMARVVGGDDVTVHSITKVDAEIHNYQPTQTDIKKAHNADLILRNGMGLERWFDKFITQTNVPSVDLSQGITPISIKAGDFEGKPNPHAWMSTSNAQIYVDNIVKAFSQLRPDKADAFRQRGDAYKKQLADIGTRMKDELSRIPKKERALVTCEGAFSYLARDAGMKEQYLWPVNAENALTPQNRARVEEFVTTNNVPAVFCESTVEDKMEPIVEATNARFGGILYVDSLSKASGPVPTYKDLLEYDARTITKALTGGKK